MSTFNISDVNFAGAYANAVTAARNSDHRNAGRHSETGAGRNVMTSLKILLRRIATAIIGLRPTASQRP